VRPRWRATPRLSPGRFESFRDRFIGYDARRIEDIWQIAYRGGFYRGGPVLMSALAGFEQALWDLKGRAYGLPVWEMLGGQVRERIRAYAWIGGDRPDEIGAAAAARRGQGFNAVKMNATAEMDFLGAPKAFDEVVQRVQAAQAEGMDVGLDFHGRVHKAMAKQLAKVLEPLGLLFIESRSSARTPRASPRSATWSPPPIALGERLFSRWDFKPFLQSGTVDIIQPDLSHAAASWSAARSRRWPRRTTSPSPPTAPWARWRSPAASSSPPARPTWPSRR
jgi:galactonate dehydratase